LAIHAGFQPHKKKKEKRKKKKKKKNFANFSKGTALTGRIGAPTDAP